MVLKYIATRRLDGGCCAGITAVAFSPHGNLLAASGLDGKVRIWNVESGKQLYVFSSTVPMVSLAWADDDECTVFCGLNDGTICRLTANQMDLQVMGFWAHTYPVEYLTMKDGFLVSGAHEEVRIWKPSDEALLLQAALPEPPKTSFNRNLLMLVTSIHWLGDTGSPAQLLVTYLNHGVHIFDSTTWETIRTVPIPGQIANASVSADGKLIAVSNVLTGFDVYSLDSGVALCSMGQTVVQFRKIPVLFIHEAAALLGGNVQGDVHLWDVASGRKLHSLIHAKDEQVLALDAHYNSATDTFYIATGILEGPSTTESAVVLWKAEELGQHEEPADALPGWHGHIGTAMFYAGVALPVLAASFLALK